MYDASSSATLLQSCCGPAYALFPFTSMKVFRRFATWFPLLVLLVPGCGRQSAPKPPATGHALPSPLVAKCEPGQPGGRLTLVTVGSPRTFNPLLVEDNASDQVVRMLFGSLVIVDSTALEAGPGLAESWAVEPDGKTWTFKLRAGLRWSDGQPLTSEDVVFTWNEVMYNPDMNRLTYDLFRINGKNFAISKVDEVTVRVMTPEIFAPFLEYFGGVPILPKHAIGREVQERRFLSIYTPNTRPEKIVGSGPFRVKELQPGKGVLLERNPEYWCVDKAGRRLPYFDEVLLAGAVGASPTFLFLNGHGDVCEQARVEEYAAVRSAASVGKLQVLELGVGPERDLLWFNLNTNVNAGGRPLVSPIKSKWFRDKSFRQAVSCAIDRDRLVKEVYGGRAQPVMAFIPTENKKWSNSNVPQFGYDLARARALLAGMGIQDRNGDGTLEDAGGNAIEFTLHSNTGNPAREKCAALIAGDLRRLGFKTDFQPMDFRALVAKVNETFDYECVLMGLGGGGVDPASQVNVVKSGETLHQWFPNQPAPATDWEARLDGLMDAQMRTLDFAHRKKTFDEVQAILAEQLPMIYTVAPLHLAAARADLANLRPSLLTPYRLTWNVEQLYFRKP